MKFKFKAIKNNGERYEGILESPSEFDLYNELKAEGNILVSAEELSQLKFQKWFLNLFSFFLFYLI